MYDTTIASLVRFTHFTRFGPRCSAALPVGNLTLFTPIGFGGATWPDTEGLQPFRWIDVTMQVLEATTNGRR